MRARRRRQRHRRHAGQGLEPVRQRVDQLERALHGRQRLQRMDVGEARQPRQLLVEPRIVLHRARAERVEPAVDRVVLLRQPREMAHDLRLAEPRQADRRLAVRARRGGARTAPARADRRRSGPGESCSKISGSSICRPRLPLKVCRRCRVLAAAARSAPGSSSLIAAPPRSAAAPAGRCRRRSWSRSPRPAADRRDRLGPG